MTQKSKKKSLIQRCIQWLKSTNKQFNYWVNKQMAVHFYGMDPHGNISIISCDYDIIHKPARGNHARMLVQQWNEGPYKSMVEMKMKNN